MTDGCLNVDSTVKTKRGQQDVVENQLPVSEGRYYMIPMSTNNSLRERLWKDYLESYCLNSSQMGFQGIINQPRPKLLGGFHNCGVVSWTLKGRMQLLAI